MTPPSWPGVLPMSPDAKGTTLAATCRSVHFLCTECFAGTTRELKYLCAVSVLFLVCGQSGCLLYSSNNILPGQEGPNFAYHVQLDEVFLVISLSNPDPKLSLPVFTIFMSSKGL